MLCGTGITPSPLEQLGGLFQESCLQPSFGLPQICTTFHLKGEFNFALAEDLTPMLSVEHMSLKLL